MRGWACHEVCTGKGKGLASLLVGQRVAIPITVPEPFITSKLL